MKRPDAEGNPRPVDPPKAEPLVLSVTNQAPSGKEPYKTLVRAFGSQFLILASGGTASPPLRHPRAEQATKRTAQTLGSMS